MSIVRPLAGLAAGFALAAAVSLAAVAPASAHDELVDSDPADGAALAEAPESISLEFSGDVLTLGAVVVVSDAGGTDWVDGELAVGEGVVEASLVEGMPDAGYEVRWRVVSADGHPISGVIPFTVGDGEPLVRDAAPETPEAQESDTTTSDAASAAEQTTSTQITQEGGIPRAVLIGALGAAVAAAGFALYLLIRRRAASAGDTGSDAHARRPEDRKETL